MRSIAPAGATERERDQAIRQLIDGRGNGTGAVTLTPGAATTIVKRDNGNALASVVMFPMTANAAAATTTTYIRQADVTGAGFTVTHAVSALTDRTFFYAVVGG